MRRHLLILSLFLSSTASAQHDPDSLLAVWRDTTIADSTRFEAVYHLAYRHYMYVRPDSSFLLAREQYEYAVKQKDTIQIFSGLFSMGKSSRISAHTSAAYKYFKEYLELARLYGDEYKEATALRSIGTSYLDLHQHEKTFDYYNRSIEIFERLGEDRAVAGVYNNIGIIYWEQDNYQEALKYYEMSLAIKERWVANGDSSAGTLESVANTKFNIAEMYREMGDYEKQRALIHELIPFDEATNDIMGLGSAYLNLGTSYVETEEYEKAIAHCQKALEYAKSHGVITKLQVCNECLYQAYKLKGEGGKALEYYEQANLYTDSLEQMEEARKVQAIEFKAMMEQDSIARAKAEAQAIENERIAAAIQKRENRIQYSAIIIFVFLLGSIIAISGRFKIRPRIATALIFIFFILLFEFILVVMDPLVEVWSDGQVGIKLAVNSIFALIVFAGHQFFEGRLKRLVVRQ